MAVEKVTPMVLKVDLQCHRCYKKIKKTLCKFPQIRDQVYDEKANTVAITVVCCSPEKIRDKLCSKGGKVIKSIEIKEPAKPKVVVIEKPKDKSKEAEKPKEKPKEAEMPKEKPKEAEKAEKPKSNGKGDKPKADGAPPAEKPAEKPKEAAPKAAEPAAKPPPAAAAKALEPVPANGVPSIFPYCGPTYDAYAAGPYYHGYGFPPPPPQPCYEGFYGYGYAQHGYGHAHGYGRGGHVTRCDGYFSEENPQGCSIM